MKYILKIFMIAVAMVTAIPSFAVTDKEMEQARALAAKHYLRYANNGSDYLDKLNPSSVAELNKSLKAKEIENLKSFNAVAVPKDYASWNKDKLVEYWSSTFFKAPGLKEDGKKCLGILARNLKKINVATPAPKAETPSASPAPEATELTKTPDTPTAADQSADKDLTTSESAQTAGPSQASSEVDAVVAQAEADAGLTDEQPKKSSNTGWYIGILIVLVGVVIWLVMYASKSMKETGASAADNRAADKEIRDTKRAAKEEMNKMREQYASSLTSKNEEIKQLKSQCESLEAQLEAARSDAQRTLRELEVAKRELAAAGESRRPASSQPAPAAVRTDPETRRVPAEQRPEPKQQSAPSKGGLPPVVFLGHVNQKGLFVKASRSLNLESSVYRMEIPDGYHGKYKVVKNADILDRILENPELWLAGGCVIENPEDADIAAEIVTLQEGEALFSDNSLRVTKKARIKFI